jgi:beta-mannanase
MLLIAGIFLVRYKAILFDDYSQAQEPVVGLFDKDHQTKNVFPLKIEHYNVVWKNTALWSDKRVLENGIANHDVLITVETWLKGMSIKNNVLVDVTKGGFDKKIQELAGIVSKSRHQVYIRLDPDMEVPVKLFPWQFQSAELYIQAFNCFAKKIKQYAPNIKMVWGPSGYPGDTEYWPGNKEVDFVSITLGSASEHNTNTYPAAKTIPEMLRSKLHRLRFINKPVLILGSNTVSKSNFNSDWVNDQIIYFKKFSTVIYNTNNYVDSTKVKPVRNILEVGVFDPTQRLINQKEITVEHLFATLSDIQRGTFEKNFNDIIKRHHDPMVTVEPWRDTSGTPDTDVINRINNGHYDPVIKKLFHIISSVKQTVYLRWLHEMEIPIHRYPWQSQDPVAYINAFRYFMRFEGGPGKNVKRVWGPAGDRGSIDFWPGEDVVDYISIAIYGLPDKNITDPNQQESFSTILNRKYFRMRFLDKPLFIAEFGVKGPQSYQDKWLSDAANAINANPHIFGVCYFNLYDNPKAWGAIKAPDWSITARSMRKFCSNLTIKTN